MRTFCTHETFYTTEGAFVELLEEDDGSGWVKVADEAGGKGLVPASYISMVDTAPHARQGIAQAAPEKVGECGKIAVYVLDA